MKLKPFDECGNPSWAMLGFFGFLISVVLFLLVIVIPKLLI